jgi:hypothetical protein
VTIELTGCPVCGGPVGECGDTLMASIPLEFGAKPKNSGKFKSGRFYTTTERIIRNNRLVLAQGTTIPWEDAAELGLVEPLPLPPRFQPPIPIAIVLDEEPDTPADVEDDVSMEPVTNPEVVSVVKRRKKTTPGAKLGSVE